MPNAAATQCGDSNQQPNSLHAFIEPQMGSGVDTRYWVFFRGAPPLMLESMGSNMRWILIASMGGLLLLVGVTGAAALIVFHRLEAGEAAQRARLLEHSTWLRRVENGIYLSGTLARDYFADPQGAEAPALLARLSQTEEQTREAAAQSSGGTLALRGEVTAYWKMLNLMLDMAHQRTSPGVDAYFRRQLTARRENMLHIAGEIGSALDGEWRRGEAELAARSGRLRWLLAAEMALGASLGLVLSVGAGRRLLHLEGETRSLSAQLERAQEEERRSIARELHDEIGQAVSAIAWEVGRAASMAESGPVRTQLAAVSTAAERTVEAVRRISLSLRPSMLDDLGLVAALEWQAREVGNRTGLDVEVLAEDSAGEMPDAQRTCIYRVTQEALQNCVRHAGASAVRIGLTQAPKSVKLHVEDNGKGFRPARTRGLGLLGMEERVTRLGGRLLVRSEPGRGTTLSVELPL
jgi:signal transduction histidine kinase